LILMKLALRIMLIAVFTLDAKAETENLFELPIEQLLDVEIKTASKFDEKQSDAPGIISVITRDEIDRFGGYTLKDILDRVPGLTGTTQYIADRSMFSARGDQVSSASNHVLLLINGSPVREVIEGGIKGEVYKTFPVSIIERIEVVKGPGSVLYGSTAVSAVINVITKSATKNSVSVRGDTGTRGGSYGISSDAMYKSEKISVVAAIKNYKKPEWNTNYKYVHPVSLATISNDLKIPDTGTGSFLNVNYKNLRFVTTYNEWETLYVATRGVGNGTWKNNFNNISYSTDVNSYWNTSAGITLTQATLDVTAFPNFKRYSLDFVVGWNNFIKLSDKTKLTAGTLFNVRYGKETDTASGIEVVDSDASRIAGAVYSQLDYRPIENLNLIGGFQLNKIQNIDPDFVPRAGIVWHPAANYYIKTLYSEAFRAPSINELSLNFLTLKGNPNLKPETIQTVDLSVGYIGEKSQAAINYFYTNQKNIIYQDRTVTPAVYNNIGRVKIQGVEFEGKQYLNREFMLVGSTLYQVNKDGDGVENVVPISTFSAKAGVSYKSDRGVTASVFDVYQNSLDSKYNSTINPSPGKYNIVNFYFKLDINKLLRNKSSFEFSPTVQIDNAFDKSIWLPAWGLTNGTTMPYDQGRVVFAGINVSYMYSL
jgi:outer membrane receptor for ferrienterochelin and colicins